MASLVESWRARAAAPESLEIVPLALRDHVFIEKSEASFACFQPSRIWVLRIEFQKEKGHRACLRLHGSGKSVDDRAILRKASPRHAICGSPVAKVLRQ